MTIGVPLRKIHALLLPLCMVVVQLLGAVFKFHEMRLPAVAFVFSYQLAPEHTLINIVILAVDCKHL